MRLRTVFLSLSFLPALFCGQAVPDGAAIIERVEGEAFIERAGGEGQSPLTPGSFAAENDVIATGTGGVVILRHRNNTTIEVQSNARFRILSSAAHRSYEIERGNVWMDFSELDAGAEVEVRSPTAIAAVRGTRFYTFEFEDEGQTIHGTCHCQGAVAFRSTSDEYNATHEQDFVVLNVDGRTVLITPEDLAPLTFWQAHAHSALPDGPIGQRAVEMSPADRELFRSIVRAKLAAL